MRRLWSSAGPGGGAAPQSVRLPRLTSNLSGYSSLEGLAGHIRGWPVNDPLPDSPLAERVLGKFRLGVVQMTTDALSSTRRGCGGAERGFGCVGALGRDGPVAPAGHSRAVGRRWHDARRTATNRHRPTACSRTSCARSVTGCGRWAAAVRTGLAGRARDRQKPFHPTSSRPATALWWGQGSDPDVHGRRHTTDRRGLARGRSPAACRA
jgi:hypothetical protein